MIICQLLFLVWGGYFANLQLSLVDLAVKIESSEHQEMSLTDLQDGIIIFGASWCPRCKELLDKTTDFSNIIFIGVGDTFEESKAFAQKYKIKNSYLLKENHPLIQAIPAIFFKVKGKIYLYRDDSKLLKEAFAFFQENSGKKLVIDWKIESVTTVKQGDSFAVKVVINTSSLQHDYAIKDLLLQGDFLLMDKKSWAEDDQLIYWYRLKGLKIGSGKVEIDLPVRTISGEEFIYKKSVEVEVVRSYRWLVFVLLLSVGIGLGGYGLYLKYGKREKENGESNCYREQWVELEEMERGTLAFEEKIATLANQLFNEGIDIDQLKFAKMTLGESKIDYLYKKIREELKDKL